MGMKLPVSANMELDNSIHDIKGAYIKNPFPGKDLLTVIEAIDIINQLSGMLLADSRMRKIIPSKGKKIGTNRTG